MSTVSPLSHCQRYDFRIQLKRNVKNHQVETIEQLKIQITDKCSNPQLNAFNSINKLQMTLLSGQGSSQLHLVEGLAEQIVNGYRQKVYLGSWLYGYSLSLNLGKLEEQHQIVKKIIAIKRDNPNLGLPSLPLPSVLLGRVLSFLKMRDLLNILCCTKLSASILEPLKNKRLYDINRFRKESFNEVKSHLTKILSYVQNETAIHCDRRGEEAKEIFHSFRYKAISWMTKDNSRKLAEIESLYNQITQTIERSPPPPLFPFPTEISLHILHQLRGDELGAISKVNKTGYLLSRDVIQKLVISIKFPSNSNDWPEYHYLQTASKLLQWLISKGYFCLDYGIKNEQGEILIEETLKKLKELAVPPSSFLVQPAGASTVFHALIKKLDNSKLIEKQLQILVEWGVDLNGIDEYQYTPLHALMYLLGDDHEELILAMIKAGANLDLANNCGDTPLHFAVQYRKSINILKTMLEQNPDVNCVNNDGNTPLLEAAINNVIDPIEIGIQLLLNKGANLDYQNPLNGDTVFHCLGTSHGEKKWVKELAELANPSTLQLENHKKVMAKYAIYWATKWD